MVLSCCLLFLLTFLVLGQVRPAQAAPWQVQRASEGGGSGYPASLLDIGEEPLGNPATPSMIDGFQTSQEIPALDPESHPTGPPRAKDTVEEGKLSPEISEVLRKILENLKGRHAVSKTRWNHASRVWDLFGPESDLIGKRPTHVVNHHGTTAIEDHQSITNFFHSLDMPTKYMIIVAAALCSVAAVTALCCLVMQFKRCKKKRVSEDFEEEQETTAFVSQQDN